MNKGLTLPLAVLGMLLLLLGNLIQSKAIAFSGGASLVIGIALAFVKGGSSRRPTSYRDLKRVSQRQGCRKNLYTRQKKYRNNHSPHYNHNRNSTNRPSRERYNNSSHFIDNRDQYDDGAKYKNRDGSIHEKRVNKGDTYFSNNQNDELAYFYARYDGAKYPLVDEKELEQVLQHEKFKEYWRKPLSPLIDTKILMSKRFVKIDGYVLPRNYVTNCYVMDNGMSLVTFSGEQLYLCFNKPMGKDDLRRVFKNLQEIFPNIKQVEDGKTWYRKNAISMAEEAVWDSQRVNYDGMERILQGFPVEDIINMNNCDMFS